MSFEDEACPLAIDDNEASFFVSLGIEEEVGFVRFGGFWLEPPLEMVLPLCSFSNRSTSRRSEPIAVAGAVAGEGERSE